MFFPLAKLIFRVILINPDERNATERSSQEHRESHLASTQDQSQNQKDLSVAEKARLADSFDGNSSEKIGPDESVSDGADVSKSRPMSPGTLALMCDEQDAMFTTAASPSDLTGQSNMSCQLPHGQGLTEAYAEQERIVLTKFRDCLNKLVTLGEIKGKLIFLFSLLALRKILFSKIQAYLMNPNCLRPIKQCRHGNLSLDPRCPAEYS